MNVGKSRAGLGASSILLIIVVLCLTAFGALTLMTARVDWKLTERTSQAQIAYYEADASAQAAIAQLDAWIRCGSGSAAGWTQTDGRYAQTFPVGGDGLVLEVIVEAGDGGLRIERYRTKNEGEWNSQTQWKLF